MTDQAKRINELRSNPEVYRYASTIGKVAAMVVYTLQECGFKIQSSFLKKSTDHDIQYNQTKFTGGIAIEYRDEKPYNVWTPTGSWVITHAGNDGDLDKFEELLKKRIGLKEVIPQKGVYGPVMEVTHFQGKVLKPVDLKGMEVGPKKNEVPSPDSRMKNVADELKRFAANGYYLYLMKPTQKFPQPPREHIPPIKENAVQPSMDAKA